MASAPSFTTDRIRNVVVVGHGGSGKTTLIDAACYTSGTSRRQGVVDEGTALTMFTPESEKIAAALRAAELENMTPLEAMNLLAELKQSLDS